MPLQPLSPIELAIHRMEQQVQALQLELTQMKAFAASQRAEQPKRELVYKFAPAKKEKRCRS